MNQNSLNTLHAQMRTLLRSDRVRWPDALSFGPIASTRRMCPDAMQQEGAFLQALENAHRYSISGEDLAVQDASGVVTMRFEAVYLQ